MERIKPPAYMPGLSISQRKQLQVWVAERRTNREIFDLAKRAKWKSATSTLAQEAKTARMMPKEARQAADEAAPIDLRVEVEELRERTRALENLLREPIEARKVSPRDALARMLSALVSQAERADLDGKTLAALAGAVTDLTKRMREYEEDDAMAGLESELGKF